MQNFQKRSLAICALLLCAQFSMDQDETSVSGGGKKPAVNFKGTIVDNTGRPFKASHINISGLYKQIPVYSKPVNMQDSDYNPTINMIRLDLAEVTKIEVPDPERVHVFKERKYILLSVYLTNNSQKKYEYIIEDSKRVFCNQVNGPDPIERELGFPAIQTIHIHGYEKKEDKPASTAPRQVQRRAPQAPRPVNHPQLKKLPPQAPTAPRPVQHRAPTPYRPAAPAA